MKAQKDKHGKEVEEQPQFLQELLSAINAARRQASLYGADHGSLVEPIESFRTAIASTIREVGPCTMVFTKARLVVNDHFYLASNESKELCGRMRARGAMAIDLLDKPSPEEVAEFMNFLNARPADVREVGGPSAYLEARKVRNIRVTDAIYARGGPVDSKTEFLPDIDVDPILLDSAVQALIGGTGDQAGEGEPVDIPLDDILTSPEATAKLIWESVVKIHTDTPQPAGEIGYQVIQNLKQMASEEQAAWDLSTPQIRKAVSSLPSSVRGSTFGFLSDDPAAMKPSDDAMDVTELETMVAGESDELDDDIELEELFNIETTGLLSAWQKELQPDSILRFSGRTLATLIVWETDPVGHGQLARALALLIHHGLAMNDVQTALSSAESLLKEANVPDAPAWRSANAKSALQSLSLPMLETLVERSVESDTSPEVVASLIETIPLLAPNLTRFLRTREHKTINDAIKRRLAKSGMAAASVLRELLIDASAAAREAGLETLVQIGADWTIREIAEAMEGADDGFLISALTMLPAIHNMSVTQICANYTRHRSVGVRIAALRALGKLGDPLGLGALIQAATHSRKVDERIAAIHSLAQVDHPDSVSCLNSIISRQPLFWRSRYEPVRAAALHEILRLRGEVHED